MPEQGEGLAVMHGVMALGRRLRSERPPGSASIATLSLLGTLTRSGPLPAAQLAAAERLQPQSLTRLIAALEKEGLIERHRSDTDRRSLMISVTPHGRAVLVQDLRRRHAWLEQAMNRALTPQERRTLLSASEVMMKLALSESVSH